MYRFSIFLAFSLFSASTFSQGNSGFSPGKSKDTKESAKQYSPGQEKFSGESAKPNAPGRQNKDTPTLYGRDNDPSYKNVSGSNKGKNK